MLQKYHLSFFLHMITLLLYSEIENLQMFPPMKCLTLKKKVQKFQGCKKSQFTASSGDYHGSNIPPPTGSYLRQQQVHYHGKYQHWTVLNED